MDKALRNAIIAGIIIIAISFGYYLVVFLPKKEAMRIEQQKQEADQQKQEQEANALKEQQKADKEKQTRADCYDKATEGARELLKKKADLKFAEAESAKRNTPSNPYSGTTQMAEAENMKAGVEKNLFLQSDFDKYYEDCLSKNGLQK